MKLFQKLYDRILKKYSCEKLFELLERYHEKKKYIKLASIYYELGNRYLKEEKKDKALVYFIRFNNLVQSDDKIFTHFMKRWSLVSDLKKELKKSNSFECYSKLWMISYLFKVSRIRNLLWNV